MKIRVKNAFKVTRIYLWVKVVMLVVSFVAVLKAIQVLQNNPKNLGGPLMDSGISARVIKTDH